jgi:hypothetical protein
MREECNASFCRKIPQMGTEIQSKKHIAVQVKCPQLLTDCSQTCTVRSACVDDARHGSSGKYLQWKPRNRRKSRVLTTYSYLKYCLMATKRTVCAVHATNTVRFVVTPSHRYVSSLLLFRLPRISGQKAPPKHRLTNHQSTRCRIAEE